MANQQISPPQVNTKKSRGKRCVVMHCSNTNREGVSLFVFPKDTSVCRSWIRYVGKTRGDSGGWQRGNGHICSDHFVPHQDYDNFSAWSCGYQSRPRLKPHAVPTAPHPRDPSTGGSTNPQAAKRRNEGDNTEQPPTKTNNRRGSVVRKLEANRVSGIQNTSSSLQT